MGTFLAGVLAGVLVFLRLKNRERAVKALLPVESASDVLLIQRVKTALGQDERTRGLQRQNVSSCESIVTLHGIVSGPEERRAVEDVVREVAGVREVINEININRS